MGVFQKLSNQQSDVFSSYKPIASFVDWRVLLCSNQVLAPACLKGGSLSNPACQLLSLDLSLAEHGFLAEFPYNNSGVSEAGPGVAPTHRGPRRSVAGGLSRGSLRGEVGVAAEEEDRSLR